MFSFEYEWNRFVFCIQASSFSEDKHKTFWLFRLKEVLNYLVAELAELVSQVADKTSNLADFILLMKRKTDKAIATASRDSDNYRNVLLLQGTWKLAIRCAKTPMKDHLRENCRKMWRTESIFWSRPKDQVTNPTTSPRRSCDGKYRLLGTTSCRICASPCW